MLSQSLAIPAPVPIVPAISSKDIKCLTDNIYHEARGEPLAGQVAVAKVTINRTKHKSFPKNLCEVVYQPKQFSWTIKKPKKPVDIEAWNNAKYAAYTALASKKPFPAIYYHNLTVKPGWAHNKKVLAKIGGHVFL